MYTLYYALLKVTWSKNEKFVTSQNNGLNHMNYVMSLYLGCFNDSYC